MEIPSWYDSRPSLIEYSEGVPPGVGSNIEPYMTLEQVKSLKDGLKDELFRMDLASFIGMIASRAKYGGEDNNVIIRRTGFMAIDCFITLTQIAESDEWPTGYSPPEFFDQAIVAMSVQEQ